MITCACDSAGDLVDRCNEKPGGGAFNGSFEVLGKAAVAVQPCDCPLDYPATWQKLEALGGVGAFDDFQGPCADFGERVAQFVSGISPIGEDVTQPREGLADAGKDIRRTVAILDIGGVNDGPDQQALRVSNDVALATFDLLARVKAPWAATFCRFHTLAIDDTRAGRSFPTYRFTRHQQQSVVDRFPHTHRAPAVEIMLDRGHGRKQPWR